MAIFTGRRQIFTQERDFTDENIVAVINKALSIHEENSRSIQVLYDYYRGKQNILNRTKEIRPEICAKIVENHAAEIVNFKTGFTFGEPVQYVYRGKSQLDDNGGDDNGIALLNQLMDEAGKSSKDRELAEWFYICGVAHRITVYDKVKGFQTFVGDPRSTFVVYSDDYMKEPLLGCTYSFDDTIDGQLKRKISVYSKDHFWLIESDRITESSRTYTGNIPIVEYRLTPSRQGSFENVITLIDALNLIESNRMDGIEQFIQTFIWFNNCEVTQEQFDELKERGGIQTKSSPGFQASIQMLNSELDQQQSQTFVDYLYESMLTIAAVPDRKASAGGNTGQALVIGQGWTMAESAAKAMELEFKSAEKCFLDSVLTMLKNSTKYKNKLSNIGVGDIDIKFTRNKTDNLLTKTQGLQNQLEAGINPRIAIANCGLYSDPEQVYLDSLEYLEKWKVTEDNTDPAETDTLDTDLEKIIGKLGTAVKL